MKIYCCHKRRWILFFIYWVLLITLIYFIRQFLRTKKENIQCYRIKTDEKLRDISTIDPRKGQSMFFHETSCRSYQRGKIMINSRQACAVESAARLNPNFDIYLLYSSPGIIKFDGDESDKFLRVLMNYQNVNIMHLDFENYTRGTPVEALYTSGKIDNSLHVIAHSSDVLRYVTLWKYGGIYMDLDVLVLKSLENLKPNFAGIESDDVVASGVLSFDPIGNGHILAEECLNDLKVNFDNQAWSTNGPGVITRLLKSLCLANTTKEMINNNCKGFNVLPKNIFYPVRWQDWEMYFDEKFMEQVTNLTRDTVAIHAWNKLSNEKIVPIDSNVPYLYFARKNCPKVVEACDNVF